jgi:hypothetical protein
MEYATFGSISGVEVRLHNPENTAPQEELLKGAP